MNKRQPQLATKFCLLLILFFSSCYDGKFIDTERESPYEQLITHFLESRKIDASEENINKIDELIAHLNFSAVTVRKLSNLKKVFMIEVDGLSAIEGKIVRAVFTENGYNTFDVRIVSLEAAAMSDANALIESFILNKQHTYSGKASIYSLFQQLMFFNVFENGELKVNGVVKSEEGKGNGRTDGCIAWYLVTTYYWSDGTTTQSSQYLGTTCDCDQYQTRTNTTMCGGGSGGGGDSGGLPANPQPGDLHVVDMPNGVSRIIEYQCEDWGCAWVTITITLPEVVVEANRIEYSFLPINPFHNQFVLGPDDLLYNFNANWQQWVGMLNVENKVTTPCLRSEVESIINNEVASDIQDVFDEVFNNDAGNNMYTFTQSQNPGYTARTFKEDAAGTQFRTDLNAGILSTASGEFTTIVIYHEIVHAILYSEGMLGSLHHTEILTEYVDKIAQSGISIYPNLPLSDARAIALFGLSDIASSQPATYDQVASSFGLTRAQIDQTGKSYRRDTTEGNVKKGTPCN